MNNNDIKQIIENIEVTFKYDEVKKTFLLDDTSNIYGKVGNAIYKSHNENLPTDWIYNKFYYMLDALNGYDIENMNDIENFRHEIINSNIDIYNYHLKKWTLEVYNADQYIDEALSEFSGNKSYYDVLQSGQFYQLNHIFDCITELIEALSDK